MWFASTQVCYFDSVFYKLLRDQDLEMSSSKGVMRQVEEKYAMNEIDLIVWSNKIDLLALSNAKGKLLVVIITLILNEWSY